MQGRRHLFSLSSLSSSKLDLRILSERIGFDEACSSTGELLPIFLECCSFPNFQRSSLCAFRSSLHGQSWRLGIVWFLHPLCTVVIEIFPCVCSDSYHAIDVFVFEVINSPDDLKLLYINRILRTNVASDGCISSSPMGPDVVHINNWEAIQHRLPDTTHISPIVEMNSMQTSKSTLFPSLFSTSKKSKSRSSTFARTGALHSCSDTHQSLNLSGFLWEAVPSYNVRKNMKLKQGLSVKMFCLPARKSKDLDRFLSKPISVSSYNQYLQDNGTEVNMKLYSGTPEGVLFSKGKTEFEKIVPEPIEHFKFHKEKVLMHCVRVHNGTFTSEDDLHCLLFVIDHYLGSFNFSRSCGKATGTNFYYGRNQDAYVRPTPSKAQPDIFKYFLWRQTFCPLFAPLLSNFLNKLTFQALNYDMAFNQVYHSFQTRVLQCCGKQMGLWHASALTILTKNFSNEPHMDKNDMHGKLFNDLSYYVTDNIRCGVKKICKQARANKKKRDKSKHKPPLVDKATTARRADLNSNALNYVVSMGSEEKGFCRSTTCGYKVIPPKNQDEELFATFTNTSLKKSILLENDVFVYFYGGLSEHCTTKPIVVNWKDMTVRNLKHECILGWGSGRSAQNVYLRNHGVELEQNHRVTNNDIRNYFVRVQNNVEMVQDLQAQPWFDPSIHQP